MKVVKFLRSPEKKGKKNRLSPSLLLPRPHRPSPPSGLTPFFSLPFSPARSLPAALLPRPFQVLRIHQVSHSHVFPWTIRYFVRCFEEYFLKALVNPAPDSLGPPPFFPSDPSGRRLSSKGKEEGGFAALGRLPLPPLFYPRPLKSFPPNPRPTPLLRSRDRKGGGFHSVSPAGGLTDCPYH